MEQLTAQESLQTATNVKGNPVVLGLVDEMVILFKDKLQAQEISPYDVAEAFAVALSGTIYSLIPPEKRNLAIKESEPVVRKTLKSFNHQVDKKNIMFASQLLAAAKISSYVVTHGNRIIRNVAQENDSLSTSE